jgi:hypothetical protein
MSQHVELRAQLASKKMKTRFNGCSTLTAQQILQLGDEAVQYGVYCLHEARDKAKHAYDELLGQTSLHRLASLFPQAMWEQYQSTGWSTYSLGLRGVELRMIDAVHRTLLIELGIDPLDARTHGNAWAAQQYDSNYGWLRQPALTFSQSYLVTHPKASPHPMLYSAIPCHTKPYHTIPYHTIPYHTIPTITHDTMPGRAVPYHTIPCHTMPCRAVPCRAMPCHTIPRHTIPYHTIPYHTIPYHTIPYHMCVRMCVRMCA